MGRIAVDGGLTRRSALMMLAMLAASPRRAMAEAGEAVRFVQQLGRDLAATAAGAASEAEKRTRIAGFLEQVADLDGAARFCLGRYWRLASPEQRDAYRKLFAQSLAAALAARVDVYKGGASQVSFLPELAGPDGVLVRTVVRSGGQAPVRVNWLVDMARRPPRIVDVEAEGLSLRLTKRSDYVGFLSRHDGDIGLFLDDLRARSS